MTVGDPGAASPSVDVGLLRRVWQEVFEHRTVLLDLEPVTGPGLSLRLGEDLPYDGASMIKTFLAGLISTGVGGGAWHWSQPVPVDERHRTGGDGVLGAFTLPIELPLRDLVTLMITVSDNTATNAVIDLLGGPAVVNERLAATGLRTRLRSWVGGAHPDPTAASTQADERLPSRAGLSVVVPGEHHELIARLSGQRHHGVLWSMLEAQQDRRSLARWIDEGAAFAHKTGTVDGVRHDSGLLALPGGGWIHVTCFTDGVDTVERVDHPACVAMGRAMAVTVAAAGASELLTAGWDPGSPAS